jgi:PAS domain S-box-containing protein
MTRFESRPVPGDAEFDPFAASAVVGADIGADGDGDGPVVRPPGRAQPSTNGHRSPGGEPRFHSTNEREFDVVAVLTAEGRFVFVSASAERMFGYDISTVIGQDAFGLFDDQSVEPVRALFRDLVARRRLSVSLEMQTHRADGTPIDLDVVAVNHLEDPIGGIVVNIRDNTERTRLEQQARDVDGHQSAIIEALADGVVVVDEGGTVVGVNEAFEVMFEAPRIHVLGRRLEDALYLGSSVGVEMVDATGQRVTAADHPVIAALRSGRRSVGVVFGVRRPGREDVWIRANLQPMVDAAGTGTGTGTGNGAVASFSDITSVRRVATELRRDEQFLQVLLDTLEEGIVACDAEGRITFFNPSARRLHGLSEESDPIGTIPGDPSGRRRP